MTSSKPLNGHIVLVTGAGGVIGRLFRSVLTAQGATVVAHYRKPPVNGNSPIEESELRVFGDLTAGPLNSDHLDSVTHIVHLAATLFHFDSAAYYRDNLSISLNLAQTARQSMPALRQIVHVSSLAARGPGRTADYPDLMRDVRPVSDYGRSKLVSEQALKSTIPADVQLSVLRAGVVLSADDHRLSLAFRRLRNAASIAARNSPRLLSCLTDKDTVSAAIAAIATDKIGDGIFEVCHSNPLNFPLLVEKLGAKVPPGTRMEGNPPAWLQAMATFAGLPDRVLKRKPLITNDKIHEMSFGEWLGDPAPFEKLTGWTAKDDPNDFVMSQIDAAKR